MKESVMKKTKILIAIVVIVLFIWFLGISPIMKFHKNEEELTAAAKRYFEINGDKLPTGERVKTLSLNTLYKESYLENDFKAPYTGKVCSLEKSWVKVVKENGEYKYYTYLDCGVLKSYIDHEGPVIELKGDVDMTLNVGDEYKEPGVVSVIDKEDGQLNIEDVSIKGEVDTSKVGEYEVEYTAFDNLSNKGSIVRTVKVVNGLYSNVKKELGDKTNYSGAIENNYIMFSHVLYRIYGIDKNKNVIIVANEDISNINHTKIEKWLDEVYYNSIDDEYKKIIVKSKYCNMSIPESELENVTKCDSYTKKRYSYIPSIFEINNAQTEEGNYLKPTTSSWTATGSGDKKAYYSKNIFFGKDFRKNYVSENELYNYGVKPMLTIKGNLLLLSGDGTIEKPYMVVKNDAAKGGTKLNTRHVGEFVKIGGLNWRIIGTTKDGMTRVVSIETIRDDSDKYELSSGGDDIITYNPKKKNNIGYLINNKASKLFDSSNFKVSEITVPIYKNRIIYGEEVDTKKYNVKFRAPDMYEMFSSQSNEDFGHVSQSYWLVNSSKTKRIHGVVYDVGVPENEEIPYYQGYGVRVVGCLKKDMVISDGKGSYNSPYILK